MIYGVMARGSQGVPPDWIAAMADRAARWPADYCDSDTAPTAHIAIRERSAYAGAPRQGFARNTAHVLLFDGRLDNRAELAGALGAGEASDAEFALAALERWGEPFAQHLMGDFAIAACDAAGQRMMLARDAMGIRPLFLAETADFLAFASNMDVLLALPWVDRTPDTFWLVDYLEKLKSDEPSTFYRGIHIVSPAHTATITPNTSSRTRHWSPPPVDAMLDITLGEAVAEYSRLFDQAVACRLPANGPAACELSGGLDSTAIAATAAPMLAGRGKCLLTLSHVVDPAAPMLRHVVDEREEITALLGEMPPVEHHWLDTPPPSHLAQLAETVARHGGPQRRDFAAAQPRVAAIMRANDCRVLFSGHGGDQCATSNGAGLAQSLAEAGVWDGLRPIVDSRSFWLWRFGWGRAVLRRRALGRLREWARQAPRFISPDVISDADLLARRLAFPLRPAWGTIAERERAVITSPHIAERTQDCAVGSGPDGFSHVYPMLDQRLVEFCLRVPDHLKRTSAQRRVLIRAAMAGRLPDGIRLRDNKSGAILPVAMSSFYADIPAFRALFARHRNNPQITGLVDLQRIDSALETYAAKGAFEGGPKEQQIRRAAQLCLLAEQQVSWGKTATLPAPSQET
ncbi:asparagine synthetase B family protein [Erythrobacter sp. EC-HK427]|uniref:asparagine synthetase B family protein n=1 Tax=Erythrobacter sp. EC-HK427 TaxID=2038396 RepID=UPI001258FFF5|nr:asparagine synthase-related protein [Erythrobacter sp. EC-HK427]VVS97015.1 conserved hypothetical protein [Erythrobacter sp. EC-HK427]